MPAALIAAAAAVMAAAVLTSFIAIAAIAAARRRRQPAPQEDALEEAGSIARNHPRVDRSETGVVGCCPGSARKPAKHRQPPPTPRPPPTREVTTRVAYDRATGVPRKMGRGKLSPSLYSPDDVCAPFAASPEGSQFFQERQVAARPFLMTHREGGSDPSVESAAAFEEGEMSLRALAAHLPPPPFGHGPHVPALFPSSHHHYPSQQHQPIHSPSPDPSEASTLVDNAASPRSGSVTRQEHRSPPPQSGTPTPSLTSSEDSSDSSEHTPSSTRTPTPLSGSPIKYPYAVRMSVHGPSRPCTPWRPPVRGTDFDENSSISSVMSSSIDSAAEFGTTSRSLDLHSIKHVQPESRGMTITIPSPSSPSLHQKPGTDVLTVLRVPSPNPSSPLAALNPSLPHSSAPASPRSTRTTKNPPTLSQPPSTHLLPPPVVPPAQRRRTRPGPLKERPVKFGLFNGTPNSSPKAATVRSGRNDPNRSSSLPRSMKRKVKSSKTTGDKSPLAGGRQDVSPALSGTPSTSIGYPSPASDWEFRGQHPTSMPRSESSPRGSFRTGNAMSRNPSFEALALPGSQIPVTPRTVPPQIPSSPLCPTPSPNIMISAPSPTASEELSSLARNESPAPSLPMAVEVPGPEQSPGAFLSNALSGQTPPQQSPVASPQTPHRRSVASAQGLSVVTRFGPDKRIKAGPSAVGAVPTGLGISVTDAVQELPAPDEKRQSRFHRDAKMPDLRLEPAAERWPPVAITASDLLRHEIPLQHPDPKRSAALQRRVKCNSLDEWDWSFEPAPVLALNIPSEAGSPAAKPTNDEGQIVTLKEETPRFDSRKEKSFFPGAAAANQPSMSDRDRLPSQRDRSKSSVRSKADGGEPAWWEARGRASSPALSKAEASRTAAWWEARGLPSPDAPAWVVSDQSVPPIPTPGSRGDAHADADVGPALTDGALTPRAISYLPVSPHPLPPVSRRNASEDSNDTARGGSARGKRSAELKQWGGISKPRGVGGGRPPTPPVSGGVGQSLKVWFLGRNGSHSSNGSHRSGRSARPWTPVISGDDAVVAPVDTVVPPPKIVEEGDEMVGESMSAGRSTPKQLKRNSLLSFFSTSDVGEGAVAKRSSVMFLARAKPPSLNVTWEEENSPQDATPPRALGNQPPASPTDPRLRPSEKEVNEFLFWEDASYPATPKSMQWSVLEVPRSASVDGTQLSPLSHRYSVDSRRSGSKRAVRVERFSDAPMDEVRRSGGVEGGLNECVSTKSGDVVSPGAGSLPRDLQEAPSSDLPPLPPTVLAKDSLLERVLLDDMRLDQRISFSDADSRRSVDPLSLSAEGRSQSDRAGLRVKWKDDDVKKRRLSQTDNFESPQLIYSRTVMNVSEALKAASTGSYKAVAVGGVIRVLRQ
ncbi:hypothetical protein HDU96_005967 [Phlyctochytrium bullatum]|nr:hypothetical protein HDU96_005967 [Phlyctochytrium bullatum]